VLFSNCSDSVALISMIPLVLSHYRTQLQLFAQMCSFSVQIKGNKSYTVRNLRKMNPYAEIAAIRSDRYDQDRAKGSRFRDVGG
ncbi:hypothetical protein BSK50_31045, partial [Paenibacillus odorifer]